MSELDFLKDLQTLSENAFPKKCTSCGKVYKTVEEYLTKTEGIRGSSGIKAINDEDENFLEMYRNCECGSTLMDYFQDRRDTSEKGLLRRKAFDKLLTYLVSLGLDEEESRAALKKLVRQQPTDFFKRNNIDLASFAKKGQ